MYTRQLSCFSKDTASWHPPLMLESERKRTSMNMSNNTHMTSTFLVWGMVVSLPTFFSYTSNKAAFVNISKETFFTIEFLKYHL